MRHLLTLYVCVTLCSGCGWILDIDKVFNIRNPSKVEKAQAKANKAIAHVNSLRDLPITDHKAAEKLSDSFTPCFNALRLLKTRKGYNAAQHKVQLAGAAVTVDEAYKFCRAQLRRLGDVEFDSCAFAGFMLERATLGGATQKAQLQPNGNSRIDYFTRQDNQARYATRSCANMSSTSISPESKPYVSQIRQVCGQDSAIFIPNWRTRRESANHVVRYTEVHCWTKGRRAWFKQDVAARLKQATFLWNR